MTAKFVIHMTFSRLSVVCVSNYFLSNGLYSLSQLKTNLTAEESLPILVYANLYVPQCFCCYLYNL